MNIEVEVKKLIYYALKNELIFDEDIYQVKNSLCELLQLNGFYYEPEKDIFENVELTEILNKILEYSISKGIIQEDTILHRDLFDTKIMGMLTPRQSEVANTFWNIAEKSSITDATDYFYELCKNNNYIRMDRINKNQSWLVDTEYGKLKITVNLAKPELDPRAIAAAVNQKKSTYPKCLLCADNIGYYGNLNHPARQNLRVIPMKLSDEKWYFQYSPYVYYNEHCILLSEEHRPMRVDKDSISRMFEFLELFPHYFLGANAGLPIVGGSILSHDHYQGGRDSFPIENAPVAYTVKTDNINDVKVEILKWPMSTIRLTGKKEDLINTALYIISSWKDYTDESVGVYAISKTDDLLILHNAVTPILFRKGDNLYSLYLVLRNNRTSDEHPDGIFHPHKEHHHIKKENIGVIEVMGLAILPGRLDNELSIIKNILAGEDNNDISEDFKLKHGHWVEYLVNKYGTKLNKQEADKIIKNEVGYKFIDILRDSGVFKEDEQGRTAFKNFLINLGFAKICDVS